MFSKTFIIDPEEIERGEVIDTNRKKYIYIFAFITVLLFILYFLSPNSRHFINEAITELSHGDIERVKNYMLSYGVWAPAISNLPTGFFLEPYGEGYFHGQVH